MNRDDGRREIDNDLEWAAQTAYDYIMRMTALAGAGLSARKQHAGILANKIRRGRGDDGRRVKINHKTLCAAWVNHGWDGPVQLDPSKCNCGATDSEAGEVGRKSVFDDLADCIPGGMDEGEVRLCDHFHRSAWQAATKRERTRAAEREAALERKIEWLESPKADGDGPICLCDVEGQRCLEHPMPPAAAIRGEK